MKVLVSLRIGIFVKNGIEPSPDPEKIIKNTRIRRQVPLNLYSFIMRLQVYQ